MDMSCSKEHSATYLCKKEVWPLEYFSDVCVQKRANNEITCILKNKTIIW